MLTVVPSDDPTLSLAAINHNAKAAESFVLPMLYDIEDSEADDQELIRMSAGTMRKKDIHEGKEYEDDGEGTPRMDAIAAAANGSKTRRRK